jgi:hypothetical protein
MVVADVALTQILRGLASSSKFERHVSAYPIYRVDVMFSPTVMKGRMILTECCLRGVG